MPRPIQAVIRPAAVRHNLTHARSLAPRSRIWGVVKANAYGHGIENILEGLEVADGAGLLDLDEAARLRQRGWTRPILLLEGFFAASDLREVVDLGLTTAVHCAEQIDMLAKLDPVRPVDVYLKLNSGMNRLGFGPGEYASAYHRLRSLRSVGNITHMTHFANADTVNGVADALARFESATRGLPGERSCANSAATILHPEVHFDWIRPGVLTYGASPIADRSVRSLGLVPAMQLHSKLLAIQALKAGDRVGYGGRFTAPRAMRIGIVACGYADGYPRTARDGTPVAVAGQRTGIVGQVSMDMLMVDLTGIEQAHCGCDVELWGELIDVDEVARCASTLGYELLCALAQRVPVVIGY
jgi:alanine racemase